MQAADVWSCGVMLYVMLSAQYPFGRPEDTHLKTARQMHVMLQVRAAALSGYVPEMQAESSALPSSERAALQGHGIVGCTCELGQRLGSLQCAIARTSAVCSKHCGSWVGPLIAPRAAFP